ncbi:hypothetical protein D3C76_78370 [compost metagenome]|jgi:hypothetical protein|uniref:Uncharacterized protein n=2 Tax=Pseudomonas putida TaxID=303 RepID=A0A2J7YHB0_PSEPU|nr:hypothetical protein [Pseudomonas putida]AFO51382.1 hypothetical protein T1E_5561 [Pseudomonas putida DOT-T1E]WPE27072.1 hypothetical protein PshuTeo1_27930 [Pseudomonas hunanensis]EKT4538858.1 hypothetical protein [Pseudomonas putida]PNG87392.1 hypothetical protein CBL13_01253 [Pseudomonas putida]QLJ11777.1 hypothetical protein H0H12_14935 [Pseudomonas putida]
MSHPAKKMGLVAGWGGHADLDPWLAMGPKGRREGVDSSGAGTALRWNRFISAVG